MGKGLFTSDKDFWETPPDLFYALNNEFNFTIDVASSKENAKCERYYTIDDDGLSKSWEGERVFCNPPYGRQIKDWVRKAYNERNNAELIVLLVPARTDTSWFHDYILYDCYDLRFIRGRIKFELGGKPAGSTAPFPSMIVVYKTES